MLIVNMSVWESAEALADFTYRSDHLAVMRRRREWFEGMAEAHLVLWWVPAGHAPDVEEAKERLDLLRRIGPSPEAFTFRALYPFGRRRARVGRAGAWAESLSAAGPADAGSRLTPSVDEVASAVSGREAWRPRPRLLEQTRDQVRHGLQHVRSARSAAAPPTPGVGTPAGGRAPSAGPSCCRRGRRWCSSASNCPGGVQVITRHATGP